MIDDESDGSGARNGHEDGWWTDLYDDTVAEVLMRRTPEESAAACDYLTRALALSPGARVFDQGCGPGGLAVPLAQRGMRVFGVDLNGGYIERARAAAEAARVEATFLVGDALSVVPPWPCDAALCWGTGFGNAARDEDNLRMLRQGHRADASAWLRFLGRLPAQVCSEHLQACAPALDGWEQ